MAKQQGTNVYVYSETGGFMFNKTGNLVGYTSNTVYCETRRYYLCLW